MKRIDLHCDTLVRVAAKNFDGDLYANHCQIDLQRLLSSEAFIQFFAIYLSQAFDPDMEKVYQEFQRVRGVMNDSLKKYSQVFNLITNKKILEDNYKNNKLGAVLTIEDGAMINNKYERIDELYKQGVRLITLTWNYENCLGYPNSDDAKIMNQGLKPLGIETVKHMNEIGMIVDVSHLSDGGFWDVLKYSKKPIMASHSNSRAVTNHRRNMTDEMIGALAENGGVMGMNFCPAFCGNNPEYTKVSDIVEHIKHIKNVGGIDVIALGSDYDGIGGIQEMKDCTEFYKLYDALKQAHFTDKEIEKIWYKNAYRIIESNL